MEISFTRVALLAAALFFVGCDQKPQPAKTHATEVTVLEGKTMGTFWRASIPGIDAKRSAELKEKIQTQLDADDQLLSTYKKDSALMRFNDSQSLSPWPVSEAMAEIVTTSLRIGAKNEENAYKLGAVKYITLDVTQEYYEKSLKYMVFGNVLRNGTYPISVSSERIFQALAIARYANEIGADAIAHGSTGAGNDQIRFDMTFLVMAPGVEIITLTRDMALSRQEEIDYLNKHGFAADFAKLKYSYNVGLWGTSICGGEILDSAQGLPESAYLKHCTKEGSEQLRLTFEKGELKAVNDEKFDDPIKAIQKVEEIGAAYGIGRDMHVGDTIIGIKGRVGFEAAAPMLIIGAHKFLEKYTLSKWQQYWKDQVANWYGMFLHESQYLEPVMRDIEAMLESSQRNVNGTAILELHPLCFSTVGVESDDDLVKNKFGEYGEMQKGWTAEDAKGFIKVTSTALRAYYSNHKDEEI